MKKFSLCILVAFVGLSACTQRQYTFRKKITVHTDLEEVSAHEVKRDLPASPILVESIQQHIPLKQPEVLAACSLPPLKRLTPPAPVGKQSVAHVQVNTAKEKHQSVVKYEPLKDEAPKRADSKNDILAILGFSFGALSIAALIFSFGGLSISFYLLLAIVGLYLSTKGFDAQYRKLAIAGFVMSALVLVWALIDVGLALLKLAAWT